MYIFKVSDEVIESLKEANIISPSVSIRLGEIVLNPYSKAIPTNIELIGNYYINTGRYCILFNVNEIDNSIEIIKICYSSYLHKILTGKISPI